MIQSSKLEKKINYLTEIKHFKLVLLVVLQVED